MDKRYTASVKVMNSYDYGHFEMTLGTTEPVTMAEINEMRKDAQRLVDNAPIAAGCCRIAPLSPASTASRPWSAQAMRRAPSTMGNCWK